MAIFRKTLLSILAVFLFQAAPLMHADDMCPIFYGQLMQECFQARSACQSEGGTNCYAAYDQCTAHAELLLKECLGTIKPPSCGSEPCPDVESSDPQFGMISLNLTSIKKTVSDTLVEMRVKPTVHAVAAIPANCLTPTPSGKTGRTYSAQRNS